MPIQGKYTAAKGLYHETVEGFASGTLDLNADVSLTSTVKGDSRNNTTFQLVVAAAADNDAGATGVVKVAFTGTKDAIICTVTPDSTPAEDFTTAQLAELINHGSIVGVLTSITDLLGLRTQQTATGGDATALAPGGEGDEVTATFSGAPEAQLTLTGVGISGDLETVTQQIVTVTCPAASVAGFAGSSIAITDGAGSQKLFWFKHNAGAGDLAAPSGYETAINVAPAAAAAAVGAALHAVVNAMGSFTSVDGGAGTITVTNAKPGAVAKPDMLGSSFTSAVTTAGSGNVGGVLNKTGVSMVSTSKPATLTLADLTAGEAGTLKFIQRTDAAGGNVDLSVATHQTSQPEVFRFDAQNEKLTLIWLGDTWATCQQVNADTSATAP